MVEDLHFNGLADLLDYIADLVAKNVKGELKEKSPLGRDDIQDQIRSAVEFMRLSESQKRKGDYWLALRYLVEDLKYYESIGDMGKCGHILLETADCLFSCGETTVSSVCCSEAIALLVGSRNEHEWAKEVAATGELLLTAVSLNVHGHKEAVQKLREVNARLPPKERRALAIEDAHKVARRIIIAYRTKTDDQLRRLSEINPRRKKTEEKNLHSLLIEWMGRYNALRDAVERISPGIGSYSERPET